MSADEIKRRLAVYAFDLDGYDSLPEAQREMLDDIAEWIGRHFVARVGEERPPDATDWKTVVDGFAQLAHDEVAKEWPSYWGPAAHSAYREAFNRIFSGALRTEREMHNAWRKRAEEAEAELRAGASGGQEKLHEAAQFAMGAIEDAIYTEDGLDGAAGEAVLTMLREAGIDSPLVPKRDEKITALQWRLANWQASFMQIQSECTGRAKEIATEALNAGGSRAGEERPSGPPDSLRHVVEAYLSDKPYWPGGDSTRAIIWAAIGRAWGARGAAGTEGSEK